MVSFRVKIWATRIVFLSNGIFRSLIRRRPPEIRFAFGSPALVWRTKENSCTVFLFYWKVLVSICACVLITVISRPARLSLQASTGGGQAQGDQEPANVGKPGTCVYQEQLSRHHQRHSQGRKTNRNTYVWSLYELAFSTPACLSACIFLHYPQKWVVWLWE